MDLSCVIPASIAAYEAAFLQAIHEAHGAVMTHLKPPGHGTYGWLLGRRKALQNQKRLMLRRLEAGATRGLAAEDQKLANLRAELRKCRVFRILHYKYRDTIY